MNSVQLFRLEPYRFLFLIGCLHLILGISIWLAFGLNWIPYPGLPHARLMIEGFLLSFSMGFLMTAIPRFSQSAPASGAEVVAAGVLSIAAGAVDGAAFGAMLLLVAFAWRRNLFRSQVKKPSFFIFIAGGIFFGLVGASIKTFFLPSFYTYKVWLYEGMMLMWLCGIGSRILVMLLDSGNRALSNSQNQLVFLLLFVGILIQPFGVAVAQIGDALRFLAIAFLSFTVWRIHHPPFKRGALAWGVWLGILFLNLGHALRLFRPSLGVHAAHLIFVGGFCTLALMVSVRVSIAHSGDSLTLEKKYSRVAFAAALFSIAALTRFSAGILHPDSYFSHLTYAVITLLIAIPFWASVVIPRLRRDDTAETN